MYRLHNKILYRPVNTIRDTRNKLVACCFKLGRILLLTSMISITLSNCMSRSVPAPIIVASEQYSPSYSGNIARSAHENDANSPDITRNNQNDNSDNAQLSSLNSSTDHSAAKTTNSLTNNQHRATIASKHAQNADSGNNSQDATQSTTTSMQSNSINSVSTKDQSSRSPSTNHEENTTTPATNDANVANHDINNWVAPTLGPVITQFTSSSKGVDYGGKVGQAIYAVGGGKVVYSGDGLKGYGNLIIIKHDNVYLSAYAHNNTNLVREGAIVKKGQKIATMGKSNNVALLHFEVRQNGKPIAPPNFAQQP